MARPNLGSKEYAGTKERWYTQSEGLLKKVNYDKNSRLTGVVFADTKSLSLGYPLSIRRREDLKKMNLVAGQKYHLIILNSCPCPQEEGPGSLETISMQVTEIWKGNKRIYPFFGK